MCVFYSRLHVNSWVLVNFVYFFGTFQNQQAQCPGLYNVVHLLTPPFPHSRNSWFWALPPLKWKTYRLNRTFLPPICLLQGWFLEAARANQLPWLLPDRKAQCGQVIKAEKWCPWPWLVWCYFSSLRRNMSSSCCGKQRFRCLKTNKEIEDLPVASWWGIWVRATHH